MVLFLCLVPQMDCVEVGLSPSPPVNWQESEGECSERCERRSGDESSRVWGQEDPLVFCEYAAPAFGKGQLFFYSPTGARKTHG